MKSLIVKSLGCLAVLVQSGWALTVEAGTEPVMPFIYGAQYYRAPTPEREFWAGDLKDLRNRGFNTVKFWVQWRWSERERGKFVWDDLDELMSLAEKNGLHVILNLILDVMPEWVECDFPDAVMVSKNGVPLHGQNILCRQLGGYPGPCYAHAETTELRKRFARAAFEHFKDRPALLAWDVWNEPERDARTRSANVEDGPTLCFCSSCQAGFRVYCRRIYGTIENLNRVWGRCYTSFEAVEAPRMCGTVRDFIDWRTYEMEQLMNDAKWRLESLREIDNRHVPHVHIVPDDGGFNPLTGIDDFEMARMCDVYGASMVGDPFDCNEMISSSQGRLCYNAEWHINWGRADLFPPIVTRNQFLSEQLSQLGWGVMGYLFWQYRTESLGLEAPAWGLIRLDGRERATLTHATEFWKTFAPYAEQFKMTTGEKPVVALWKSVANEMHQVCRYGRLDFLQDAFRHYIETLYALNVPQMICDTKMIEEGRVDEAKMLIVPQGIFLTKADADAFKRLRGKGVTIFSESSLGAYDGDRNRYSATIPGFGLDLELGVREEEMTSACHLPNVEDASVRKGAGADDVSKAMNASGVFGGDYFPLVGRDGTRGFGAKDFLRMAVDGQTEVLASFRGAPVAVRRGSVYYAGTQFALAAKEKGGELFENVLKMALVSSGIRLSKLPRGLHRDVRFGRDGKPEFVIYVNRSGSGQKIEAGESGHWKMLFSGDGDGLEDGAAALYVREPLK